MVMIITGANPTMGSQIQKMKLVEGAGPRLAQRGGEVVSLRGVVHLRATPRRSGTRGWCGETSSS